jgi:hypothetical protein
MNFHRFSAAIATVALLSCLPLRGYAADGTDATALLAKHRAYVGWQLGDGSIQTLRINATYANADGKKAFTFTELHHGLIDRTTTADLRHDGILSDDGFTGNIFWQSDENGFTTPQLGETAKFELAWDALFSEATTELPGVVRGAQDVDGKSTQIVRVTMTNGEAIDLYEDPDSGAYVQAVISPEGQRSATIHILSYADAMPGKKIIGSYRLGKSRYTTTDTKIEANVPIPDAEFHPPTPRATWTFASAAPFPMKATDKRLIVDAKVNGVAGRFIVDTGADGIYLTSAFAKRAQVKPFSSGVASGIGGTAKTEVDRIASLELGGNTLSNVIAYSGGDSMDTDAPDGLIGFSLFGGAIVSMDSSTGQMTISDPTIAAPDSANGVLLNVDLQGGVPQVPMKIDGTIDVNATLDSGNFYYVLFGKDLITNHGLKMLVDNSDIGAIESHPELGGVGGYEADRCGHIDSIALGPIVYQNAPACESPSFDNREILIGYDYLRHFNFVFDYPHGQLLMTPHKD